MPLTEDAIARIEAVLAPPDVDMTAVMGLRREFPSLSFTQCDVSDLGVEEPFRQYPLFNLYLVDASDHCYRLTLDPKRATGVVMAAKPVSLKKVEA